MKIIGEILTVLVAVEHLYILWMEMFAWETAGKRVFGKSLPKELFRPTKGLAANQGLYNGFLVAGLVWSFLIENPEWSFNVRAFFLGCVIVAGIYGGLTASKKIILLQAVPAMLALLFCLLTK
ncbi:DUF1304 domain-containing protein [Riemerella anatipestifer]|uniref:DUF1304 domain-containing protein n=1 Tax=Riemerella anatipestifer TaxID=34085 RepID=UPI001AD6362A|nr:DUF1304 domain-containing protein [Riemerella anatipestifer]MBO4234340.1 DUF1304 domain-containing protein [Riemerella anatipestifer]MDY3521423.1 DUF1304 domain-containing protein [Riemerella anatipestifer]MDY3532551.1 DUF1304 domain-containing protein [Riemerella anatipestifer]MDY3534894.1 DUF1304 domain-containing protein [Riemerella anatipestifer]